MINGKSSLKEKLSRIKLNLLRKQERLKYKSKTNKNNKNKIN